jgi:hypothetical protein
VNDKNNPHHKLTITGQVEKFASITPKHARLVGPLEKKITASVAIVPRKKYPFEIIETRAKKGENFDYKLEKMDPLQGKGYVLTLENLKKEKGRYYDTIILKTNNKTRPLININVYGNITDNSKRAVPIKEKK